MIPCAGLGNAAPCRGLSHVPQMEPTMISLKILSTAAAMALALPLMLPSESFAQNLGVKAQGGHGGGGGAPAAAARGGGGGGGLGLKAAGGFNPGGAGGFRPGGGAVAATPQVSGGAYRGGYGGGGGGYYRQHRGGGFIPGAVAGAVVGGAIASQSYAYSDTPGYYAPGYYDNGYYDDSTVAVAPAPTGDDSVGYCMQTYRSYDPASGTYLGYDGMRHPCP
jgi:hypothetical protein